MSPGGGDKPGLGGTSGGTGIGNGTGAGSGLTGEGSGAGKTGTGTGSEPNVRGGISPTPGPGGAGESSPWDETRLPNLVMRALSEPAAQRSVGSQLQQLVPGH